MLSFEEEDLRSTLRDYVRIFNEEKDKEDKTQYPPPFLHPIPEHFGNLTDVVECFRVLSCAANEITKEFNWHESIDRVSILEKLLDQLAELMDKARFNLEFLNGRRKHGEEEQAR